MNSKPPSTPQSADYVVRVEKACAQLAIEGKPITADAVAALAGIGRATLYRRPELRALIEEHRQQARESLTLTGPGRPDRPAPQLTRSRRRQRPPPRKTTPPPEQTLTQQLTNPANALHHPGPNPEPD